MTNSPETDTQVAGIEVVPDFLKKVEPEFFRFLPLPDIESESWQLLFEIFEFLSEMDQVNHVISPDLEKCFVLHAFRQSDSRVATLRQRYAQGKLPGNDREIVYDLLAIDESWFTYCYYQRVTSEKYGEEWIFQPEMKDDFDAERWRNFEILRQEFLEKYYQDIEFSQRFKMVRELRLSGFRLGIRPDVNIISGFDSWWIGDTYDRGSESGFSSAMYIPENPTIESLAAFVEKNGMLIWNILEDSFAAERDGVWSFWFRKDQVLLMNRLGFMADTKRIKTEGDEARFVTDITLVTKLTAHLSGLWEIAKLIRFFKRKNIPQLMSAFTALYERRVEKLLDECAGESLLTFIAANPVQNKDLFSTVAAAVSGAGVPDTVDPELHRISRMLEIVDLAAVFEDPANIELILGAVEEDHMLPLVGLIESFDRVEYAQEENLEMVIMELANLPLSLV